MAASERSYDVKPKFSVGQIVVWDNGKKIWPFEILDVRFEFGGFYYRVTKKHWISESMLRTVADAGISDPSLPRLPKKR